MPHLSINHANIVSYPWIWDFLEQQRHAGITIWKSNQVFTYNGSDFKFENTVFSRERKEQNKGHGFAYEMMSSESLEEGSIGTVYRIACTISLGEKNSLQARNKQRAVKVQCQDDALREYKIAEHTKHLHPKKPINGRMVMREFKGQTLHSLIESQNLCRKDRLELTKSLIKAYKEEVIDNKIFHKDLHTKNILVHAYTKDSVNKYEVHIIDFALGLYRPNLKRDTLNTYKSELCEVVRFIWRTESYVPSSLYKLIRTAEEIQLTDYINGFDKVIFAPTPESQIMLNRIIEYFDVLTSSNQALANELYKVLSLAAEQSSKSNMNPLRDAIPELIKKINTAGHKLDSFPYPIFETDERKQRVLNSIYDHYDHLDNKGKYLKNSSLYKNEGDKLCELVPTLRKTLFETFYMDPQNQNSALLESRDTCKGLLKENQNVLDIHRDKSYIWGEIAIILSSLIVLYPLIAGIHYLATGRRTFFGQTQSAARAEKIVKNIQMLAP